MFCDDADANLCALLRVVCVLRPTNALLGAGLDDGRLLDRGITFHATRRFFFFGP